MGTTTERLKKLKELALRGVGGEREQAAAMLEKLIKKYGVSMDDLDETIEQDFEFTYHGQFERQLIAQIAYKVCDKIGTVHALYYVASGRKCSTTCLITCTEAQKIEIEFLFDFYKRIWKKEVDSLFSAFIQKHELFGRLKDGEKAQEISDEELAKLQAMMHGLSDESPLPQIEQPKKEL